jgi:hypothetical protein
VVSRGNYPKSGGLFLANEFKIDLQLSVLWFVESEFLPVQKGQSVVAAHNDLVVPHPGVCPGALIHQREPGEESALQAAEKRAEDPMNNQTFTRQWPKSHFG